MKVALFMAMSLNGLIARPDCREDFLSRQNWDSFVLEGFAWPPLPLERMDEDRVEEHLGATADRVHRRGEDDLAIP